jgi:hypothetical protein
VIIILPLSITNAHIASLFYQHLLDFCSVVRDNDINYQEGVGEFKERVRV